MVLVHAGTFVFAAFFFFGGPCCDSSPCIFGLGPSRFIARPAQRAEREGDREQSYVYGYLVESPSLHMHAYMDANSLSLVGVLVLYGVVSPVTRQWRRFWRARRVLHISLLGNHVSAGYFLLTVDTVGNSSDE